MLHNELGQTTQELRCWTASAIECYLNGLVCANCTLPNDIKQQCKMKPCVLELVKKFGKPREK